MTRRRLRWLLLGDAAMIVLLSCSLAERALNGKGWWHWDIILFLLVAALVWVYVPAHKWVRYLRRRNTPYGGWGPGDRVNTAGRLGTLRDHPARNDRLEVDLDRWVVQLDDGDVLEGAHYTDLRPPSVIDRLGDLVRLG